MTALLYVALSYYCISFLEGSTSRGTHAALWVVMAMALAVRPESLAVIGSALIGGLVLRRGVLYLRGGEVARPRCKRPDVLPVRGRRDELRAYSCSGCSTSGPGSRSRWRQRSPAFL